MQIQLDTKLRQKSNTKKYLLHISVAAILQENISVATILQENDGFRSHHFLVKWLFNLMAVFKLTQICVYCVKHL